MFYLKVSLLVLIGLVSFQSYAAEWSIDPAVSLKASYNDNIRFSSTKKLGTTGYTLEPRMNVTGVEQGVWSMQAATTVKSVRYNSIEGADSDSVFLNLNGRYSVNEINQLSFTASYEDNTNFNLANDTESNQSGLIEVPVESVATSFAPYWTWSASEKGSITLGASVSEQQYDEDAPLNYNGYSAVGGNVSFGWLYTEKIELSIKLSQSLTESRELDYENERQTLQLGLDYTISSYSDLSLTLGSTKVEFDFADYPVCQGISVSGVCVGGFVISNGKGEQVVSDYSFDYSNKDELSDIKASLSRNVINSSSGSATQTDKYKVNYDRSLSEKVKSGLLLGFRKSKSLDNLESDQDAQRYRAELHLSRRLTKNWDLSFRYRYLIQEYNESKIESESNTFYINLSLLWPKAVSTY